jgi:hypothetical protein
MHAGGGEHHTERDRVMALHHTEDLSLGALLSRQNGDLVRTPRSSPSNNTHPKYTPRKRTCVHTRVALCMCGATRAWLCVCVARHARASVYAWRDTRVPRGRAQAMWDAFAAVWDAAVDDLRAADLLSNAEAGNLRFMHLAHIQASRGSRAGKQTI